MKKAASSLVLVLGSVLLTPIAFATVTATATLSNLRYQLFDLDLTDGITPSVTFTSGANVYTNASPDNYNTQDFQSASGALGSVISTSSLLGSNSALARTTAGNLVGAGVGPGAVATAKAAGANSVAYASANALSSNFTLSAHTLLVFTASTSGVGITSTQLGETGYAFATVSLYSLNSNAQSGYGQSYAQLSADGTRYTELAPFVTTSFVNLGAASVTGTAYAQAYVQAYGVTVVPEPETYALFLVGLASVAFMVRRRQAG